MPRLRPFRFLGLTVDTIYGADKEHETPYMTRATIGRLRLHIFWRGDQDPDPHSHPWGFWTFPFTPYVEEVVQAPVVTPWHTDVGVINRLTTYRRTEVVRAWRLHRREASHTHRVLGHYAGDYAGTHLVAPWPVVTLVWTDGGSMPWGFLKLRDGRWCWQDWHTYVFEKGKHAPCEPPEDQP